MALVVMPSLLAIFSKVSPDCTVYGRVPSGQVPVDGGDGAGSVYGYGC